MSYVCLRICMLVLVAVSNVSAMNSLLSKAASSVVENDLDKENVFPEEVEEKLDFTRGFNYCKARLAESYEVFAKRHILQKRTPDEKESDKDVYLCDQVKDHAGDITGVTFVGASPLAVVLGKNGFMQWWDTETHTLLEEVKLLQDYHKVVSSRDGAYIAATRGKKITIWCTRTRQGLKTLLNDESVFKIAFCSDPNFLVAASWDGKITLWDIPNARVVREFIHFRNKPDLLIDAVRATQTDIISVVGTTIKMWCIETGQETVIEVPHGHHRCESSYVMSDTKVMMCLSSKELKEVCLVDGSIRTISLNKTIEIDGEVEPGLIFDINDCCFSSDGSLLVLAELDKNSLWRRTGSDGLQYEHVKDYCGASWFKFLAIRSDNLAYLVAEQHGGLQLCTIAPEVKNIRECEAQESLEKKRKVKIGRVGQSIDSPGVVNLK